MNNLVRIILKHIKSGRNVFLVGSSDSGKTWFVLNELIPFLKKHSYSIIYFKDCDQIEKPVKADIAIIDEVETLLDRDYLEKKHKDKSYYTEEYLTMVKKWHEKLKDIKQPCVYIISRDSTDEIANLVDTISKADWDNKRITVVPFKNNTFETHAKAVQNLDV